MSQIRPIIIPDGEEDLALRVVRCLAQERGIQIHILSSERHAPLRLSRHKSGFYPHSANTNDRARLEIIKETARRIGPAIILPVAVQTSRLVAQHAQELSSVATLPPLAPPTAFDTLSDKLLLAQLLEREGIPHPKTYTLPPAPYQEQQLSKMKFPLMVKARARSSGGGICLCHTPQQVLDFLAKQGDLSEFFLQEFIKGPDIDVSVLCRKGEILAYTIQRGVVPSRKKFHPPAAIEFIRDAGVLKSVQRLVRAIEWSGVAHFDCIYDSDTREAKLLEANPRYWRSLLGSLKAGVNFPYLACLVSEGYHFECPRYQLIRYAKPEEALMMWLRLDTRDRPRWRLQDSAFSVILRDPLPDLAIQASRVSKILFN